MIEIRCIIAVVERGKAEKVVDAAKSAGANGATIFYGRGTGESEVKKFLNMHVEASKEIILILTEIDKYKNIMNAMVEAGQLKKPGTGIIFTVPVTNLIGLHHREEFEE
ncbi:transcriptional regulator [Tissierella sp. P1]|uniref:P-II family nitrogen regulator n=1 Tax=Tissierella carlieri TaxID=689904 RepID=A0ABT1SAD6_9FIRM|nr:P-II family nitrogen regulator [Tissierella sp. P1]MCQ4923418.1 P-II family nitrogen regulator [Tissierella carlieri]MDU5082529.1 P-II family nitrogen regulator [Bacillota bacterium]OZV11128.1 transcriptional regulator [Tissierella sp. P1]